MTKLVITQESDTGYTPFVFNVAQIKRFDINVVTMIVIIVFKPWERELRDNTVEYHNIIAVKIIND